MSTRNRSRAWFFTLDNADEMGMAQILCKSFEFLKVDYVFQLEKSESGLIHFQGVIRFKNPMDSWPDIGYVCHWERCRSWPNAKKYCSKRESRIDGPWSNINLKFRKSLIDPLRNVVLYDWQAFLKRTILNQDPEFRKIYWFWDKGGNIGKTSFARHMKIILGKELLYINGISRDILCAFAKVSEEQDVRCVIFGLTRQDMSNCSYKTLEMFGDGICFSGKYESGDIIFNPPHIICFANFNPDESKISEDRWFIRKLD